MKTYFPHTCVSFISQENEEKQNLIHNKFKEKYGS